MTDQSFKDFGDAMGGAGQAAGCMSEQLRKLQRAENIGRAVAALPHETKDGIYRAARLTWRFLSRNRRALKPR